jgi:phosphoribosylformylglycinamidine synthase
VTVLARIRVSLKPSILDPQGRSVLRSLRAQGATQVQEVRIGKLIEMRLQGSLAEAESEVQRLIAELLCNPVMEQAEYQLDEVEG